MEILEINGIVINVIGILGFALLVLSVIYLWLIMPGIYGRPDMSAFEGKYFAHRGLHDMEHNAPENSLKAFRRAVNLGYGIELDIQLSKDKVPVVFHDYTLERMCWVKGRVDEYTYEELKQFPLLETGERIPRLSDVLNLVDGKVPLIVELKIENTDLSLCPIADKILSSYKGSYCVESFNPLGLRWYRRNRGSVPRGQLADNFLRTEEYKNLKGAQRLLYFMLQNLLTNFLSRPDFIAYNHKWPHKFALKVCGLFGARKAAWTLRSEEELVKAKAEFSMYIFEKILPKLGKL